MTITDDDQVGISWQDSEQKKKAYRIIQLRNQLDSQRAKLYFDDPVMWARHRLGAHLWSKQRDAAMALVHSKRVAIRSAHATGKSFLASVLASWWIDTRPPGEAIVVTTAPSYEQVHSILWEEIRRLHGVGNLRGEVHRSDRWIDEQGRLVGFGRRPPDYSQHAFQGIHRKYVLVLLDEACGIPAWIWTAAEAITTSDTCRILAIGNPDDNSSTFANVCMTDPNWHSIKISGYDSPNVTGEVVPTVVKDNLITNNWIMERKIAWGEQNPLFQAKVMGEFADSEDGLVPLSWVRQAVGRHRLWEDAGRPLVPATRIVGVDPARFGTDKTAIVVREGDIVRDVYQHAKLDTTQTTSLVKAQLDYPKSVGIIDTIGIGAGVYDQLKAMGKTVRAFTASQKTNRRDVSGSWKFPNTRSASWWNLREMLDPALDATLALPDHDDLIADITSPTWQPSAGSNLIVEPKEQVRHRLGRSTDCGDALCMSLWIDPLKRNPEAKPQAFTYEGSPAGAWGL